MTEDGDDRELDGNGSELSSAEVASVNESFYLSAPHDYFETRLLSVGLLATNRTAIESLLLAEGVRYGTVRIDFGAVPASDADKARLDEDLQKYVVLESQILLYHAAECLLRLYLSFAKRPRIPWMEAVRLARVSEFHEHVTGTFLSDEAESTEARRHWIPRFFVGTDTRPPDIPEAAWSVRVERLEEFLKLFAWYLGEYRQLYNSAKHGLALAPQLEGHLALLDDEDNAVLSADGLNLEYLRFRRASGGTAWSRVTSFVSPDANLALTWTAVSMMRALWCYFNAMYIEEDRESARARPYVPAMSPAELLRHTRATLINIEVPFAFERVATPPRSAEGR